ncbi:MAG: di-trans,poly-cis-decaprenylcistransferase [Clostridiales bacterium]|nr:di-trans,poly-cis-decaprenylcistransferase [Clostridiales bacterium]
MKLKKLPNHIGFILDGNGRWAKKRGLKRNIGHKFGVEAVKKTVEALLEKNIKYASFFVFSTENFKRSKEEVDGIFDLLRQYLKSDVKEYKEKNVRLIVSGDLTKIPQDLQEQILNSVNETKNNDKLIVNICLNYGGQQDIIHACNNIIKDKLDFVDETVFKSYLYTKDMPPLDFLIRTSGEIRISNFMLFDLAYSELYFTKTLWPDFNKRKLLKALKEFQFRNRRFGKA